MISVQFMGIMGINGRAPQVLELITAWLCSYFGKTIVSSGRRSHSLRGCLESIKQVIFILGNREQGTGNTPKDWEGLETIGNDWGTHKKQ
jgi:hypothetical protein